MIRLLLLLAWLLPPSGPIDRAVSILFVVPTGETLTNGDQLDGWRAVAGALGFWEERSPIPTNLPIQGSHIITTSADVYQDLAWVLPFSPASEGDLTVLIIQNAGSRTLIWGDAAGTALAAYGLIVVVRYGLPGEDGLPATIAHELGHALYHLPDLPPGQRDIMSAPPTWAYHERTFGCTSLALMGAPCARCFVPVA